jgi:glutamate dehydrogenase/leucine dehydrogenase
MALDADDSTAATTSAMTGERRAMGVDATARERAREGTANDFLPPLGLEREEVYDPFLEATVELEQAGRQLDLEDWILERLRQPERELTLHLPLVRDSGEVVTVTGLRVAHSSARGPMLGPVCFAADAHLSQVKATAMRITWQCALLDLPWGGSAGAVVSDPQKLSERELRTLGKDYIHALRDVLGSFKDIIAPDVGSNPQIMAWMLDSYARAQGTVELGVVMGKPRSLWGWPAYPAALSQGFVCLLQEVLAERHLGLPGIRVALQGFGEVGASTARLLEEAGARIVAVADISGGLYHEEGLKVAALERYLERNRVLLGYPEAEAVRNADVLEAACDLLVLTAPVERQLNANNAERVKAAMVIEGAPAAVTPAAGRILEARGVTVLPEILARAGGVLAHFLEWGQNVRHSKFPPKEVDKQLTTSIHNAYREAAALAHRSSANLRQAAYQVAVDRVARTLRLRG